MQVVVTVLCSYWFLTRGLIPQDELDFVLNSPYNHSGDTFPDPVDAYLQPETYGTKTWRRLKNSREVKPQLHEVMGKGKKKSSGYNDVSYPWGILLFLIVEEFFSITLCWLEELRRRSTPATWNWWTLHTIPRRRTPDIQDKIWMEIYTITKAWRSPHKRYAHM